MLKTALVTLCLLPLLTAAVQAAQQTHTSRFQNSLIYYKKITVQGADANQRIHVLDRIFRKYRANRYALQLIQLKVERNYLAEWRSYLRKVKAGAESETRRTILTSIKADYLATGIDLSMLDAELALLPQPAPPAAPAVEVPVVASTTVHEDIVLSSFTVTAATGTAPVIDIPVQIHPRQVRKERIAKYFGASAGGLGKYGLYGYEAIVNFTDRFSLSAGCGMNTLLSTPNKLSSARQETCTGLLRYGGNVYAATGLLQRTCSGVAVIGSERTTGSITVQGIPLVVGVETGNKRGIFFALECGYTFFSGAASRTLTATDPVTNETVELELEAPENGAFFGLGFGLYFF
jgi:hypothetical protein